MPLDKNDLIQIRALLQEELQPIRQDIAEIKSDVQILKKDVEVLKHDVQVLKHDVQVLKHDVQVLKHDVQVLKQDVRVLQTEVAVLKANFEDLSKDVDVLKKGFAKLSDNVQQINNFIQIDSVGIEHEIGAAVRKLVGARFQGYEVKTLPFKTLKHPTTDRDITEFDGLFQVSFEGSGDLPANRFLIILEAKHYMTFDRINRKLHQVIKLQDYLNEAVLYRRGGDNPNWTREFKTRVDSFQLDQISKIYLCMGGPVWQEGTVTYLEDINKGKLSEFRSYKSREKISKEEQAAVLKIMEASIWYTLPKGDRYELYDYLGRVEKQGGGSGRGNDRLTIPLKSITNHMMTSYT